MRSAKLGALRGAALEQGIQIVVHEESVMYCQETKQEINGQQHEIWCQVAEVTWASLAFSFLQHKNTAPNSHTTKVAVGPHHSKTFQLQQDQGFIARPPEVA
ncbi:hypothetical protein U1Q18_041729 [Sarracenia purpurea var. burkii]